MAPQLKKNARKNVGAKNHPKIRNQIPKVACPGKILPTKKHSKYARKLNKYKSQFDGVAFSKLNDNECRNLIPFAPEWVRDNSFFSRMGV